MVTVTIENPRESSVNSMMVERENRTTAKVYGGTFAAIVLGLASLFHMTAARAQVIEPSNLPAGTCLTNLNLAGGCTYYYVGNGYTQFSPEYPGYSSSNHITLDLELSVGIPGGVTPDPLLGNSLDSLDLPDTGPLVGYTNDPYDNPTVVNWIMSDGFVTITPDETCFSLPFYPSCDTDEQNGLIAVFGPIYATGAGGPDVLSQWFVEAQSPTVTLETCANIPNASYPGIPADEGTLGCFGAGNSGDETNYFGLGGGVYGNGNVTLANGGFGEYDPGVFYSYCQDQYTAEPYVQELCPTYYGSTPQFIPASTGLTLPPLPSVPEPGSLALLAFGLTALTLVPLRRRRKIGAGWARKRIGPRAAALRSQSS